MDEKLVVSGTVEYITYSNANNGYSVFSLDNSGEETTCVGFIPGLDVGESLKLTGEYSFHSVYGHQFKFDHFERIAPEGAAAILRYLSSGAIKGVGPATAAKIVERFGDKTLEIIENDSTRLTSIKGISPSKALKISDEYKKQNGVRDVMMFLSRFGISAEDSNRVFKVLGKNTIERINFDPYVLFSDEIGFGYEKVCEIASNFDIAEDNSGRLAAGMLYILKHNLANGHTCIPLEKLIDLSVQLLGCDESKIYVIYDELLREVKLKRAVINEKEYVFLTKFYTAENYIAEKIRIMMTLTPVPLRASGNVIKNLEKKFGITYQENQVKAINMALQKGLLVLTGGPGTGKTTTLKAIISILEESGFDVCLAAPTGRAAKRMSEVTGKEAKTIHRLLEVEWDENDKQVFSRNEHDPLTCDAIIIDEMSMVDSLLFEALLRALPLSCRIIMVGDSDQLPSVGAGNVLSDIIASDIVPVVELNEVFRQAMSSLIVTNAHKIVNGKSPELDIRDKDMFMIDILGSKSASEYLLGLYTQRLPKAYGYDPCEDIQILCPSKKMSLGTILLNNMLQKALNPPSEEKDEIRFKGYTLRVGDKIMQIKNNYDIEWIKDDGESGIGVFNGDIGKLIDINKISGKITVKFDDKTAVYNIEDVSQLELSYAITVHKSQGSEFDCVIIPLLDTPEKLCYRNLLYTAVTRAKKNLIIVGNRGIISKMIENNRKTLRYTGLKDFLVCNEKI